MEEVLPELVGVAVLTTHQTFKESVNGSIGVASGVLTHSVHFPLSWSRYSSVGPWIRVEGIQCPTDRRSRFFRV